jgi:hypothetical protein
MAGRRYSREEVDAILGRALEREHGTDELSHDELVAAEREVGVAPESIERAAAEVMVERRDREDLALARAQAWRGFASHLIPYLMVNALLISINVFTTRFPWALFPLLGWGIGLFSHLFAVLMPNRERTARMLQRRRERERRREAKRRLETNAREFGHAVEHGVAALLEVATERIHEAAQPGAGRRVRVDRGESSDPVDDGEAVRRARR